VNIPTAALVAFYTFLFMISMVLTARGDLWTWTMLVTALVGGLVLADVRQQLLKRGREQERTQPAPDSGVPENGEEAMDVIITLLAALSALCVTVMVPAVYALNIPVVTLPDGYVFSFIANGTIACVAYVAFNALSGVKTQTSSVLYHLDHFCSWLAWFSINLSAGLVLVRLISNGQDVVAVLRADGATQLLVGLVLYSWLDLLFVQGHKRRAIMARLRGHALPVATQAAVGNASSPGLAQLQQLTLLGRELRIGPIEAFIKIVPGAPGPMIELPDDLSHFVPAPSPAAAPAAAAGP